MRKDFTKNYNSSVHSSIKMRPDEVSECNEKEVWENLYKGWTGKYEPLEFSVGEKVLITRYKSTFEKGYEVNFRDEVFVVDEVYRGQPTTYEIKDGEGEKIIGRFYEWEMLKFIE